MSSFRAYVLAVSTAAILLVLAPAAAQAAQVTAGAAKVDASWHVGASAGQYAGDCVTDPVTGNSTGADCGAGIDAANDNYDPTAHAVRRIPAYGMQSRLDVRAIVVDDCDGTPSALAKIDLYIPQDLLYRRAGQLIEASQDNCGVTTETLTVAATHNHSSPLYSSSSWGVWAFQDVFDVRFYNYLAGQIAEAVTDACQSMVPVRVGAAVRQFDKTARHSFGPAVADDGTPAGYPRSATDQDMTVIRFDDITNPGNPKPLANIVNYSLHPEFLSGNDLISTDYIGPLERITDRATKALTIWTQGAVGTSEPENSTFHSIHERLEFSHKEYGQAEYAASLMSDAIVGTWRDVADGGAEVPFDADFEVDSQDNWYPGPFSHPYPGVSNCRSDRGLEGNPQLPVVGLPTCQGTGVNAQQQLIAFGDSLGLPASDANVPGTDPGLNTDDFQALGIPVPENYSAPGYTGLQEDVDVHLQGLRLGEIYLPICSCEQWFDQSENIETRTDKTASNEWLGYDWSAQCEPNNDGTHLANGLGTGTWACPNPGNPTLDLPPVTDLEFQRMKAQVLNDATGWNNAENAATAESEPANPQQIKGNYSHDDNVTSAALGYDLTVPIGMANDYNGYIATYREYQRGDHYRKSLTAWGPHSSDYMASRLVRIGREMRSEDPGKPAAPVPTDQQQEAVIAAKVTADLAINEARATALGEVGGDATALYVAGLPDDGGEAEAVTQPEDVERFGASLFTWNGGSNFTDNPVVRVERKLGAGWEEAADQSGELPVTLDFPSVEGDQPAYLAGDQEWLWTAHFEAFVAPFDVGRPERATPAGTYRFVARGMRREGGRPVPYEVISNEFKVKPWDEITADDLRVEPSGKVSFEVGPRSTYTVPGSPGVQVQGGATPVIEDEIGPIDYPDSYTSPARFVQRKRTAFRDPAAPGDANRLEWYCFTCSFRPWLDAGDAETAEVTFVTASGALETVPATLTGDRWVTSRKLGEGEAAFVDAGCVEDPYGNFNGARSAVVGDAPVPANSSECANVVDPGPNPDSDPNPNPDPDPTPGQAAGGSSGSGGAGATDLPFAGCNVILGKRKPDRLRGTPGVDCIRGREGEDRIKSFASGDLIDGDGGEDRVKAGSGDDLVRSVGEGNDRIDCGPGEDTAHVGPKDKLRRCENVEVGK
ncbi:MAG: hypothetical protein ACR2OC_06965 [Solirubrobacterales bacterium]